MHPILAKSYQSAVLRLKPEPANFTPFGIGGAKPFNPVRFHCLRHTNRTIIVYAVGKHKPIVIPLSNRYTVSIIANRQTAIKQTEFSIVIKQIQIAFFIIGCINKPIRSAVLHAFKLPDNPFADIFNCLIAFGGKERNITTVFSVFKLNITALCRRYSSA